ncbi:MAG: sigma-70 family RNA polymerase sigma factor [Candidatus Pacebacteria bacterium]|nr:sigma-70 family RNA polymerase sigma factor [Candidatus Paceibacterota bacterium]MBP9843024.1 sigma-70 family RNA polymerase sigma factor [Candidatus Paceibacterota bacterium]
MDDFESAVIQHYQFLRRSAYTLAQAHHTAEDLVQDTVFAALAKRHLFQPGTDLKAWLYTILRNKFFSLKRKRREAEDPEGFLEASLSTQPNQHDRLEYLEALEIVSRLPRINRDAVMLASEGFTYQEMATTLDVVIGTVKSRVGRGRKLLTQIANGEVPPPRKRFSIKGSSKKVTRQPLLKNSPTVALPFIPAERFMLIGADLKQQTVRVYRIEKK